MIPPTKMTSEKDQVAASLSETEPPSVVRVLLHDHRIRSGSLFQERVDPIEKSYDTHIPNILILPRYTELLDEKST